MKIGDEILIRVSVVDFDSNPHGAAVKVGVLGYIDREERHELDKRNGRPVRFWIHRLNQPKVIVESK